MVTWYRRDDMELEPQPEVPPRDELLRELVDMLPEEYRLVVSMRFFGHGMTLKQLAREMERTEPQVKGLLDEAFSTFRELLEDHQVGALPAAHQP